MHTTPRRQNTTESIDAAMSRIPDTFTVTSGQRKGDVFWVAVIAKQRDPEFGSKEKLNVEGSEQDVLAGVMWWIGSAPHRRKDDA
jgi:hypothetical protein